MIAEFIGERDKRAILGFIISGAGQPMQQHLCPVMLLKWRISRIGKVMLNHNVLQPGLIQYSQFLIPPHPGTICAKARIQILSGGVRKHLLFRF